MADPIKRIQTIKIDEQKRRSCSSSQWLLEYQHATHPICDNSQLSVFICGEEGFADIAKEIESAQESIDICCWGFDPGMELVRGSGGSWPRGTTYGDLLIAAGKRKGMKVRLLVWYDAFADKVEKFNPRNMPGYTHDVDKFRDDLRNEKAAKNLSAASATYLSAAYWAAMKKLGSTTDLTAAQRNINARRDYCNAWYWAAFEGLLKGIEIRTRAGKTDAVKNNADLEIRNLDRFSAERKGMERAATHHQKPILIDFNYDQGSKAVGYVMGLNSVTDYWDTAEHIYENPRREAEQAHSYMPDLAHSSMKPLRDYACRIDRGRALLDLYQNFVNGWESAGSNRQAKARSELGSRPIPEHCLKRAPAGSPHVQIVRTQPEDKDKTIQELYFNASDLATRAAGYLYVENQYFQWEEWAKRLLRVRKQSMQQWNASCAAAGLKLESMPVMHVFIVMPVPEKTEMIPRTYDTLARLGQQAHMDGQVTLIEKENVRPAAVQIARNPGPSGHMKRRMPEVVQYANQIEKQDAIRLESEFGVKVCTAMLNACGSNGKSFEYREIYIHSKLLLIDDTFFTIGSANMNVRSMAVDSEINVATVDPVTATDLRKQIWGQLSGNWGKCDGGNGSSKEIEKAFDHWEKLMEKNAKAKDKNMKVVSGFLLPLADNRSSTTRLG
jgi:phosphatidylserine/phosphatidylglycerophosphate/cardiolipin synthase-like enzyme